MFGSHSLALTGACSLAWDGATSMTTRSVYTLSGSITLAAVLQSSSRSSGIQPHPPRCSPGHSRSMDTLRKKLVDDANLRLELEYELGLEIMFVSFSH